MKAFCSADGAHFQHEFRRTITSPECTFWRERGMDKLPAEAKLELWDWMFKCPADAIFGEHKYQIFVVMTGRKARLQWMWDRIIKGYNRMTESQRQEAQRRYVKRLRRRMPR